MKMIFDLIPIQYRALAIGALILALLTASFSAGWVTQGRLKNAEIASIEAAHSKLLEEQANTRNEALAKAYRDRVDLEWALAEQDRKHRQEMKDAEENADRRIAEYQSGARRLYTKTTCSRGDEVSASTSGSELGDGSGTRAELHPDTAADLFRMTKKADQCRVKVIYFQSRERRLQESEDKPG